jgi:hypothetical protein
VQHSDVIQCALYDTESKKIFHLIYSFKLDQHVDTMHQLQRRRLCLSENLFV